MWRLADRQLDEFVDAGHCEFVSAFASPFAMLVVADLLGVPERDHAEFRAHLAAPKRAVGSTKTALQRNPLEFLYERFTALHRGPAGRADRRRDDRPGDRDLPGRVVARGHRRRAHRREPVRRRPGDDRAPARRARSSSSPSGRTSRTSCATTGTASRTSSRRRCASRVRSRATSACRACRRPSAASTSRRGPR